GDGPSGGRGPAPPDSPMQILCLQVSPDGNSVSTVANWTFPYPYLFGIQYDPVTDSLFVLASTLDEPNAYFLSVSASTGAVTNLTALPWPLYPSVEGLGGGATVLDAKQRLFLVATAHRDQGEIVQ